MPGALETSSSTTFRAATAVGSCTSYGKCPFWHDFLRGAVSYTTGAHAIKVGGNLWHGGITYAFDTQGLSGGVPYTVRLLTGSPNAVVYRVDPNSAESRFVKGTVFGQDQWTDRRLTVNY